MPVDVAGPVLKKGRLLVWDLIHVPALKDVDYVSSVNHTLSHPNSFLIAPGSVVMITDWRVYRPNRRSSLIYDIQIIHDGGLYWLLPTGAFYASQINFRLVDEVQFDSAEMLESVKDN